MKIDFKKIFGHWTLFEILFLSSSELVVTLCFIFGPDKNVFAFIASLFSVAVMMFIAKGLAIASFVSFIYNIMYPILALTQHYYGEAILYFGLFVPMSILMIISWLRNRNKDKTEVVTVSKVKWTEYLYVLLVAAVLGVGVYYLLRALNTNELLISTFAMVTSIVCFYLVLRRSPYYAIASITNDIMLIILWTRAVISSGMGYLPTVISFCVSFLNGVYGFIHWKIEERKQYGQSRVDGDVDKQ